MTNLAPSGDEVTAPTQRKNLLVAEYCPVLILGKLKLAVRGRKPVIDAID